MPSVAGAPLSDRHRWVLFDQIKSRGNAEYACLLAVFDRSNELAYFVASQINSGADTLAGGGSHSLVVFDGHEHVNRGASNDWGDGSKFLTEALRIATELFGGSAQR